MTLLANIGLAIAAFPLAGYVLYRLTTRKDLSAKYKFSVVIALIAGLAIAVLACSMERFIYSVSEGGQFIEQHVFRGAPTIEISMRGFVDAAFDAYLFENGRRILLFRSLATQTGSTQIKDDLSGIAMPALWSPRKESITQTYLVYWSRDLAVVGIARTSGVLVAGYHRRTGQRVQASESEVSRSGSRVDFHERIVRMISTATP